MKKRTFAIVRAVAAVVLAAGLLFVSGFAPGLLMRDPEPVTDGSELKNGAYVSARLEYIMDICGVERGVGGRIRAYYAIAPIGNKFVMVRFPAADGDNITALETGTRAFLLGQNSSMDFSLSVTGMVTGMDEALAQLFADWFNENGDWMSRAGVISQVNNYGDYLSGMVIDAGRVGNVSRPAAIGMSIGAAVLLVYAVAELCLVSAGKYGGRKEKNG